MNTRKTLPALFVAGVLLGCISSASAVKRANHAPCNECISGTSSDISLKHNHYIDPFIPSDLKGTVANQFIGCNEGGELSSSNKGSFTCADYTSASTHSTWRIRYIAGGIRGGAAERVFQRRGNSMKLVARFDNNGQVISSTGASTQYPTSSGSRQNGQQQLSNGQIPFPQGRPGVGIENAGSIFMRRLQNQLGNGQ